MNEMVLTGCIYIVYDYFASDFSLLSYIICLVIMCILVELYYQMKLILLPLIMFLIPI